MSDETTHAPVDVRERVDVPGLPDGITPLTGVFPTHHAGQPHAIVLWQGAPWLVWRHPDGHWVTEAKVQVAALRSEAPVGVLDKLRELICDVAASGVAFEDERLDYLEIQIDRQTWDEVCALAARRGEGGGDGEHV